MINKIRKNSGITIIHALVSVLIFAVFSSIVLTATTTNLKSYASQLSYQQAYLTVESAVNLFTKSLEGDVIYVEKTLGFNDKDDYTLSPEVDKDSWDYIESEEVGLNNLIYSSADPTNTGFFAMLKRSIEGQSNDLAVKKYKIRTTVSINGRADFDATVILEMAIENEGTLYCNFYLDDESARKIDNNNCYIRAEIPLDKVGLVLPIDYEYVYEPASVNGQTWKYHRNEKYNITFNTDYILIEKGKYDYKDASEFTPQS